jgi:undecaprenyl phosphate N,N'-diacetylbacillosamine 1-phosphate transferase
MYRYIKRILDFFFSVILLLLTVPIFLLSYIAVKLDSKGPFFFIQKRLGRYGKTFDAYKIRTMTNKPRHTHTEIFGANPEVTKVGRFLRRYKIDELPQILNIFLGDMSFVGPRPGLPEQVSEFNEDAKMRLMVRPGLTGLAQVNGNIYLSWPQRWIYDRQYVERLSFQLDASVIIKTFKILIKGEEKFLKKPDV